MIETRRVQRKQPNHVMQPTEDLKNVKVVETISANINMDLYLADPSCLTNLLETLESWKQSLEEGYGVDVVYLDYRKAFDSVSHRGLIERLKTAGLVSALVGWIEGYLENRTMRDVVNGKISSWRKIESGVSQGAVLAPLLFLIYVNELPDWIRSKIRMFADYSKIWRRIQDREWWRCGAVTGRSRQRVGFDSKA